MFRTDCSVFCPFKQGSLPCNAPEDYLENKCIKRKKKNEAQANWEKRTHGDRTSHIQNNAIGGE